ncbi:MAG: GNAT family N-acetyltransferase [Akkermansiaceae bacterium]
MKTPLTLPINEYFHLRQTVPADAEETFALIDRNRAHLREWLPWVDGVLSVENSRENLQSIQDDPQSTPEFVLVYHDKIVGRLGIHQIDQANRNTSIGYWLDEGSQGMGLMTMAVEALLKYIFGTLNLNRCVLMVGVENLASRALAERLGFQYEGAARQGEWLHDRYHDLAVYALLLSDWRVSNR